MKRILILLLVLFAGWQTFAQKKYVQLVVEPATAEVGDDITITIKSNIQGEMDIDLPPGFVQGYNVMSGMNQEMDYQTGAVNTIFYLTQNGSFTQTGTFTVGPAYVKTGLSIYKSNKVQVKIVNTLPSSPAPAADLNQTVNGVLELNKTKVYEGEPLVVEAKVFSKIKPRENRFPYQPYTISGTSEHYPLDATSHSILRREKINGTDFYTFSYDRQVIFPVGTGKFRIEPFRMILNNGFDSYPAVSDPRTFEVIPLPGNVPRDFISGVGSLDVSASLSKTTVREGDVVELTVVISGHGNLQNIDAPKIRPGKHFIVYGDPVVTPVINYTERGAEGNTTIIYNLQAVHDGEAQLGEQTFSYFDPEQERYVQKRFGPYELTVENDPNFNYAGDSLSEETEQLPAALKPAPFRKYYPDATPTSYTHSSLLWIILATAIGGSLVTGYVMKRSRGNEEKRIRRARQQNTVRDTRDAFSQAEQELNSGRTGEGMASIGKALRKLATTLVSGTESYSYGTGELTRIFREKGLSDELSKRFQKLVEQSEAARYGMLEVETDGQAFLREARALARELTQKLKA